MTTQLPVKPKGAQIINHYEATAEMSLIMSLTMSIKQKISPTGELSRRLRKIRKHCEREFKKFPHLSPQMVDIINAKIISWSENCKWEEQVSVITFISFLLGLIEDSEYPYPNIILAQVRALHGLLTKNVDSSQEEDEATFALEVWAAYDKITP